MRKRFYFAYNPAPIKIWGSRLLSVQLELLDVFVDENRVIDACDAAMLATYINFREEYINKKES